MLHLPTLAPDDASPALTRLIQGLSQGAPLLSLADPGLPLEQLMPKRLQQALTSPQSPSWLFPCFWATSRQDGLLPASRLTLAGTLLTRALRQSQRTTAMRELGQFLAFYPHAHVPMALMPKPGAPLADGLDVLQLLAQWRWRGQVRPIDIDTEIGSLAAVLMQNATPALLDDLGRTARWCVRQDWGTGDAARQGQVAARTFAALVHEGARIGPTLNFMKFPDQIDRHGHLPVLLAMMRHAVPSQLVGLIQQLLAQGAYPDAASGHGRTALMACLDSRLGNNAVVISQMLLSHGANASLTDCNGLTLLNQLAAIEKAHPQPAVKLANVSSPSKADDNAALTSPFPFRETLVSMVRSSLTRSHAFSILDDIEKERQVETEAPTPAL